MIGLNDALLFLEVSARPLFLPVRGQTPATTGNRMQLRLARHKYVYSAIRALTSSLTFMHQLLDQTSHYYNHLPSSLRRRIFFFNPLAAPTTFETVVFFPPLELLEKEDLLESLDIDDNFDALLFLLAWLLKLDRLGDFVISSF